MGTSCRVGKFGSAVLVLVLVRKFARVEVPVSLIAHVAFGGKQVAIDAAVKDLVVSLQVFASFLESSEPREIDMR